MTSDVFHDGQVSLQLLAGTRDYCKKMESYFTAVVDGNHIDIIHGSVIAYCSYQTKDHQTWITPIYQSTDDSLPLIQVIAAETIRVIADDVNINDPLYAALSKKNSFVGISVMQEYTRDRIRLNGSIRSPLQRQTTDHGLNIITFEMNTSLVIGLCPKYIVDRRIIHRRQIKPQIIGESYSVESPEPLPNSALKMIRETDTFWLGTTEESWGSQSSHRGGAAGFLRIFQQDSSILPRLVWGDYKGNNFFHSLGSALSNPKVGISIIDYEFGHVLQMSGRLEVVQSDLTVGGRDIDGSNRHCQFDVEQWRFTLDSMPFLFRTISRSIHNPQLTDAQLSSSIIELTEKKTEQWDNRRSENEKGLIYLVLTEILPSATGIKTFRFCGEDSTKPLLWLPAQYATVLLEIDGQLHERSWTITSLSSDKSTKNNSIEITVKRAPEGLVSRYLHDNAAIGMKVRLKGIEGNFGVPSMYWTESTEGITTVAGKPSNKLWLSAGIGITPFIAHMRIFSRFHSLHEKAKITVPKTDIIWLHVDQSLDSVAALDEIAEFIKLNKSSSASLLSIHFILALTRIPPESSSGFESLHLRFSQLFGESSSNAHLVIGRPSFMTLIDLSLSLHGRSVDACGSVGLMDQFRKWIEDWKLRDISIKKFRTESFSY